MFLNFRVACFLAALILVLVTSCNKDEDVLPDAPKSCFTFTGSLKSSSPIVFASSCSANAVSYQWDFGDTKTSTEANPTHSFTAGGTFTVKLTVKNAKGAEHTSTQSLTVANVEKLLHFGQITANETWKAGIIHVVFSYVSIMNATVTIEPGAIVRFMSGAHIDIGTESGVTTATLSAKGTVDKPILFTADSDTPVAGFWRTLKFGAGDSGNSVIENSIIEYGGGSDTYGDALIKIYGSAVTIQNTILRKSLGYAVYVDAPGSFKAFTNNTLSDCKVGSLLMDPETVPSIGLNNTLSTPVIVENGYITSATATWKKLDVPYQMLGGTLYVGSATGVTWTIEAGTTIKLPHWSDIEIGGFSTSKATLLAIGTSANPITFTSVVAGTVNDRWGALHFGIGTNPLTSLKYCILENGGITGSTAEYAEIVMNDCSINIESTKILNSVDFGILLNSEARFGKFINNTIDNPGHEGVNLYANWAHTIGTGNTFNAARGIVVQADIITQADAIWLKQPVPYSVTGFTDQGIEISNSTPEGAKLTLSPGVQILMGVHGQITAGNGYGKGSLIANGTASEPILISSARETKAAGDWSGVSFNSTTVTGVLNYCTIEYGGYTSDGLVLVSYTNAPTITNCVLRNSKTYGIVLHNSTPTMSGNTFSGNALANVY
jgi:parallel beta-helix repeat protein